MNSAPATAAQTIVSLTFDDGINQSQVADMLLYHGMKGTFYINSNMIGTPGYLTKTELDTLVTNGNEIGGHTINHVDLATLSDAEQQAAICDDMQTLDTWYPGQIHSFAYPFASTGPTTQSILAAGCPGVGTYTNARTVGGLVSGTQCTACPTAESIPPGNPYYISTPESITSTTTLDEIKTFVTQAENNGGGWVPLVFHQVCDGCDIDSVSAATLEAFLTWLQTREANNTFVRTVNQVMIGDLPPPPPPPPMGPNQLINPSLELDNENPIGVADCWSRNSNGTNTATWTRTSDAHEGVFAEQLDVTAYSSGDLKLLQILDIGQAFGGCAPTVENGASYQLGAWYKSTTPLTPVVFYQDGSGWQYWQDGPLLPASADWAQMSFSTGPVPAGAQNISFGIAIQAVGTLTTDNYSMQKILDGADTTAPTVSLTSPAAGTVSGTVNVSAEATDYVGVAGVQFQLDGVNLGAEDTSSPYSISWDTLTATSGTHDLTAVARDAAGNVATSTAVTVTVDNGADTTAPTVSLTAPAAGTVTGTVSVSADAADNFGVVGVQFLLDGANLGVEVTTSPYSISWDTLTAVNGTHDLTAVARDAAGNVTTSTAVTVTVDNDTTAPTVSISAPAAGTVTGTVSVTADATDNVGVVGVQFLLDGANLGAEVTTSPYSVSWDTLTATNGTHTLTAVARDAAGNVTTSSEIAVTVDNDTTAPTVSLTAPPAGEVTGTVTVSAIAADNIGVAGVQFKLDGVNLGSEDTTSLYSISWDTLTATNGTHDLTAVARDAAGNVTTSSTLTVTVNNDTTAPTISLTAPAAGTVTGTVSVTATASDNVGVAGVQFKLDGVNLGSEDTAAPYSLSWDTVTASNGAHILTAVARDAAGNVTTSAQIAVTVDNAISIPDTTAPTVSLTAPAAGTISGTVSVSATATDNVGVAGVQFQLDGVNLGSEDTASPYSLSWDTATATDGNHILTAVARDAAGNVTTSAQIAVTVDNAISIPDTTAPTVSLTAPGASTVSGTVSVTADASDDVGVTGVLFQLDGTDLGSEVTTSPYSLSWDTTTAADGTHTLTAVARDAAGNIATSSEVTVTVNNNVSVGSSGGGGGGGGSIGLIELALMLGLAFVATARSGSDKAKSDDSVG